MDERASAWVNETYQDLIRLGDHVNGQSVQLYSTDNSAFGANIAGYSCGKENAVQRCEGSSVPQPNLSKLFSIKCGSSSYVGSDMYHFATATTSDTTFTRPYVCDGEDPMTRPQWKLLGYFEAGSCDYLSGADYDAEYCPNLALVGLVENCTV